ncbi:MAG TPA: cyclic nucleotide-binding domain-containing protein [Streptosporangiaceae bacterium]
MKWNLEIDRTAIKNRTTIFSPQRSLTHLHADPATPCFWEALDLAEQEALKSVAFRKLFAVGERLMREGELADYVVVILEGWTRITVDENGLERVLAERGPGQLIGERGGLQVRVRSASVIAIEPVQGLVITTENFSAFVSANPRVLDIVEDQLYERLTKDRGGYRDPYEPGVFRLMSAGRRSVTLWSGGRRAARLTRPWPFSGQNCTVLLTDVVDFGSPTRNDEDRRIIREALLAMTNVMLRRMPGVQPESRGDGLLTVIPPGIPTATVIDGLLRGLLPALRRHNSTHSYSARFQLRAAIDVGPVVSDSMGPAGEAIITIARLLDASPFKAAMDENGASFGLIATTFVHEAVIKHDRSLAGYSQVQVDVKKFNQLAWMKLFDTTVSSHSDSDPAVA